MNGYVHVSPDEEGWLPNLKECWDKVAGLDVAVVGGGFGGLAAARALSRAGAKVTVFEARAQVGGRVLSDRRFAKGRITELGAELVGSIHTRWCAMAREYGISLISRMDDGLYRGQELAPRVILDRLLTEDEASALAHEMETRVLEPMATFAEATIPAGKEVAPWTVPALAAYDKMSVADALQRQFQVSRSGRLWRALELFLVNNNVAKLEEMSYLALLCLVRGGQTEKRNGKQVTIGKPLMGYWNELEIYRCAEGCQRLALAIADEVHAQRGCRVLRDVGVRRIHLPPAGGGVFVTARSTKNSTFDKWLSEKIPANPLVDARRYDAVVFAVPPPAWRDIEITPYHPKDVIGLMGSGAAVKFFSNVRERFWVKDGLSPLGGSLEIGQTWEGTDNQTRVPGQDIVLSVFTGARTPTVADYTGGLGRLFPAGSRRGSGYAANLKGKPLIADWSRQPWIRTGYSSPRVGQVFTIGRELNEPFQGRLFFAGEHTQLDHFGYMEGAIRSGERAAQMLFMSVCMPANAPAPQSVLVA